MARRKKGLLRPWPDARGASPRARPIACADCLDLAIGSSPPYSRVMTGSGQKTAAIGAADHESYRILPGRADRGLVILCDHASNALPAEYGTLGLAPEELERHIAYDIGASAVVEHLSRALDAPAVLTKFSRLLIDPNRGDDDPTLIMRLSDGAVIPGNRTLTEAEREKRARLYYAPYHRAVDAVIERCIAAGPAPTLLSIHSFTESWKGVPRPWHVGILWDTDARLARPLLEHFEAEGDLVVGDNEPYTGKLYGDCLWQHGTQRGLANAIVELRQDLIRTAEGQLAWARRLERIMQAIETRTPPVRTSPPALAPARAVAAPR
jgi:predicted N-formylglutamate amidohydrolase